MDHQTEITLVINLKLKEMISTSKGSYLVITILYKRKKLFVRLVFIPLFFCSCSIYRYASHKTADNILHKASASCLDILNILQLNISINKVHTAAYIHAHCIWNNNSLCGNNSAYRHALTCMGIRHKCHPLMDKRKLCQVLSLL